MKRIIPIIGTLVVLTTSPIMAQDQLQPLSNQEIKQITRSVQRCFSEAGTEDAAQSCLDIPYAILEFRLDCGEPTNQFHMTICAGENGKVLDDLLNAEYQISIRYMKQWDKGSSTGVEVWDPITEKNIVFSHEEALRSAERAWLAYRQAECLARLGPPTYSSYSMSESWCLSSFLRDRIMELILLRMSAYGITEYDPDNFMYDEYR